MQSFIIIIIIIRLSGRTQLKEVNVENGHQRWQFLDSRTFTGVASLDKAIP